MNSFTSLGLFLVVLAACFISVNAKAEELIKGQVKPLTADEKKYIKGIVDFLAKEKGKPLPDFSKKDDFNRRVAFYEEVLLMMAAEKADPQMQSLAGLAEFQGMAEQLLNSPVTELPSAENLKEFPNNFKFIKAAMGHDLGEDDKFVSMTKIMVKDINVTKKHLKDYPSGVFAIHMVTVLTKTLNQIKTVASEDEAELQ
ncbi:uncharacterized protein LOC116337181 isoform X2 [Contarinia nasturtii]|uniref:uncharacterized protein LOC116337181 isoform X2 n=1 Tax=Contarinia nasturtii TaxID=265458 RepID=UPI0012D3E3B6|nr:uncharacterized protein LOC116337181 isoform X2 [Contarinia nasturtii]